MLGKRVLHQKVYLFAVFIKQRQDAARVLKQSKNSLFECLCSNGAMTISLFLLRLGTEQILNDQVGSLVACDQSESSSWIDWDHQR